MNFRELMIQLADGLGRHQVPVREEAKDIHGFLGHDGVHHELISRIVRTVYRRNHCGHLAAAVEPGRTLGALGPIRGELMRSPRSDICQIRFMDALVSEVERLFTAPGPAPNRRTPPAQELLRPAMVVQLRQRSNPRRNQAVRQPEGQDRQSGGE
jgi:hypothetical protein